MTKIYQTMDKKLFRTTYDVEDGAYALIWEQVSLLRMVSADYKQFK